MCSLLCAAGTIVDEGVSGGSAGCTLTGGVVRLSDDSMRFKSSPPGSVLSSGPRNDPVLSDLGIDLDWSCDDLSASNDCK